MRNKSCTNTKPKFLIFTCTEPKVLAAVTYRKCFQLQFPGDSPAVNLYPERSLGWSLFQPLSLADVNSPSQIGHQQNWFCSSKLSCPCEFSSEYVKWGRMSSINSTEIIEWSSMQSLYDRSGYLLGPRTLCNDFVKWLLVFCTAWPWDGLGLKHLLLWDNELRFAWNDE